jgi:hypothetical protein
MDIGKDKFAKPRRIGELLTAAGILKVEYVSQALQISKKTGMPLGRVLIMSKHLSEKDLSAALKAQELIRDNVLTSEFAVSALQRASKRFLTLEEALAELGWMQKKTYNVSELGYLLVDCQYITQPQLEEAVARSNEMGLTLGRYLVITGTLSPSLLANALTAQVLVRDARIVDEQAIAALKATKIKQIGLQDALKEQGFADRKGASSVRLGELFALAGLLAEGDIMVAVELGLAQEQLVGQILLGQGLVPEWVLEAALTVQNMVSQGLIDTKAAPELLKSVWTNGITVDQAVKNSGLKLKDVQAQSAQALQLLKKAGLITDEHLQKAKAAAGDNINEWSKVLIADGVFDELLLQAAIRCWTLVAEGLLREPEAMIALHYCHRCRISFDDALQELAWDIPSSK